MATYEKETGGQVLAIPHNGNVSGGRMFTDVDFIFEPADASARIPTTVVRRQTLRRKDDAGRADDDDGARVHVPHLVHAPSGS